MLPEDRRAFERILGISDSDEYAISDELNDMYEAAVKLQANCGRVSGFTREAMILMCLMCKNPKKSLKKQPPPPPRKEYVPDESRPQVSVAEDDSKPIVTHVTYDDEPQEKKRGRKHSGARVQ